MGTNIASIRRLTKVSGFFKMLIDLMLLFEDFRLYKIVGQSIPNEENGI